MKPTFSILITALLLSLLSFMSCKSDTKSTGDNNSTTTPTTEAATTTDATKPVHVPPSTAAPLIGLWHYHNIGGNKKYVPTYKGRWIDLKSDNTFQSGIYLEENNSGTWSYTEDTKLLQLMPKETEEIETEWVINGNGEFIIWIGNTDKNKTGMQIRMKKIMDGARPAK